MARILRVAFDVQHAGKPRHPSDRGASAHGLEEVSLTRAWLDVADRELRHLGHLVLPISDGEYSDRWARADAWRADIYVALHVDAGGGDRGTVFHDHRSATGDELAAAIAGALDAVVPWTVTARPCRPDDDGEPRDEDATEAYNCIQGVRAIAVLLEPGFIDGPAAHRAALVQADIGGALARGIHTWWRTH